MFATKKRLNIYYLYILFYKYRYLYKIRAYNDKNKDRLYELDIKKYPLTKRSGVDRYVYSYSSKPKKLLQLNDKTIFNSEPSFKITSRNMYKILKHTSKKK